MKFSVYTPVEYNNTVLVSLEHSTFIKLVEMSAVSILSFTDPKSKLYVQPKQYVGTSFGSFAEALNMGFVPHGGVYHSVATGNEVIEAYAELRNASDAHYVGEESHTREMVYRAMVHHHNWRVGSIEDSIEKSGANFGSATGWHTAEPVNLVREWPGRYGFRPLPIKDLPCKRPDWAARLAADREVKL